MTVEICETRADLEGVARLLETALPELGRADHQVVNFDALAPGPPSRQKVLALEEAMRSLPQLEGKVTHHFAPGIYMRELLIPKHAVITGKIHRAAHLNILLRGDISVLTEAGIRRLKAPMTILSSAGIKRVGFAHEETVWVTVHANPDDERDLEKLESRFIAPSFEALEHTTVEDDRLCLGQQ